MFYGDYRVFELEIMVTGYTLAVSTVTTIVCKLVGRKNLIKLRNERDFLKTNLLISEAELKKVRLALKKETDNQLP